MTIQRIFRDSIVRPTVRILWVGLAVSQLSTPAAAQVCKFFSPFDFLTNQGKYSVNP